MLENMKEAGRVLCGLAVAAGLVFGYESLKTTERKRCEAALRQNNVDALKRLGVNDNAALFVGETMGRVNEYNPFSLLDPINGPKRIDCIQESAPHPSQGASFPRELVRLDVR